MDGKRWFLHHKPAFLSDFGQKKDKDKETRLAGLERSHLVIIHKFT